MREHDWHVVDAIHALEVRQVTKEDEPDVFELRSLRDGTITTMTAEEYDKWRGGNEVEDIN